MDISIEVKSIIDILKFSELNIPEYQRSYKWERRHIRNLFYDIRTAIDNNIDDYRIGSIILHDNKDKNSVDIVDGQQRLMSLSLLFLLIDKENLPVGVDRLLRREYTATTCTHAQENFSEWKSLCDLIDNTDKRQAFFEFIKHNCKVTIINVAHLQEAFQLFDSQNNRGKTLEPHDLLKAYHLREIATEKQSEKTIEKWESFIENKDEKLNLTDLFNKHLFRIRRWMNGETGLFKKKYGSELKFTERLIDDFKGVSLRESPQGKTYPYLALYKKLGDSGFYSSLNMPIINGEAFFKFVEYAYELYDEFFYNGNGSCDRLKDNAKCIVKGKKNTHSRNINLYANLIIVFIDRFGADELSKEICEKVFVWAFYPRITAALLYDSTIANYAAGGVFHRKTGYQKLFQILSKSSSPREFVANINTDILGNLTADEMVKKLEETNK